MNQPTELIPVIGIFENRFYKIPDYQRGYSWEEQQLQDIKDDIENLFSKNYMHFTGTIVAAKNIESDNHFEIVDGQQRLTTLIILLKEIYNTDPVIYSDLKEIFFKRGSIGNEENVLTPNEETRVFYNELILGTGSPQQKVKSHTLIANAQIFFREWLKENPELIKDIYKVIAEKIGFILFTPKNEKEIGIMFEVINNRGKSLSELEKLKNYFIYFATIHNKDSLRKTINDKWREILENLSNSGKTSNEDENSFIRFCYIVFYETNKEKSHDVYEQMKIRYSPHESNQEKIDQQVIQMQNFVSFVASSSINYSYFFKSNQLLGKHNIDNLQSERISKTLTYLRCHPVNASIMPLYLAVMNSFNQQQPSGFSDTAKRVADLLELLEITNFRLYVLPGVFKRADSEQGNMFSFAHKFFNDPLMINNETDQLSSKHNLNKIHNGNIYDWLEIELSEMVLQKCPLKKFDEALTIEKDEDYDFYNWKDGLRFFLSCYEEKLKNENKLEYNIERMLKKRSEVKEKQNEYLSIEHIWARANLKETFNEMTLEKRRLGNLVLMGLSANISEQKESIPVKVEKLVYDNHIGRGSLDLQQVSDLKSYLVDAEKASVLFYNKDDYYQKLASKICDLREKDLINFALKRWNLRDEPIEEYLKAKNPST